MERSLVKLEIKPMKKVVLSFIADWKKFNDSGDRDDGVPCRVAFCYFVFIS
jgi:hypothetical protein